MVAICIYGIDTFGLSVWPIFFMLAAVFIMVSVYISKLDMAAIILARVVGGLALAGFLLLLLASTIGGSAHMSESNQVIAFMLFLIAMLGSAFFLIKIKHPGL